MLVQAACFLFCGVFDNENITFKIVTWDLQTKGHAGSYGFFFKACMVYYIVASKITPCRRQGVILEATDAGFFLEATL